MWFLLLRMVDACKWFERRRERLGQVHPEHLLFDQEGEPLLVNRYSWPYEFVGPQMILEGGRGAFLSPQELKQLQMKMLYGRDEPNSDSFAIGMTVLEAGLLASLDAVYDYHAFSLDEKELQRMLADFAKNYSSDSFLGKTVANLLEPNDTLRPSPGQVASLLQPYRADILAKQPFKPERSKAELLKYNRLNEVL